MHDMDNDVYHFVTADALAFLYLKNQDLSNKTPEEVLVLYLDAEKRIRQQAKKLNKHIN